MKAKVFNYKIVEVLPITELERFKDHKRMRVFYEKGCKCVRCGLKATQLAYGINNQGQKHLDLYTKNFYPLTVDHIKPKSKGGSDDLENLQPMCVGCNTRKGNGDKLGDNPFSGCQEGQFCKWPKREQLRLAEKNKDNTEYYHLFKPVIQKLINSSVNKFQQV